MGSRRDDRQREPIGGFVWQSLFLGGVTALTIYVFPFITKKIPAILAALIVGVATYLIMGSLTDMSLVKTVSTFESEIPLPKLHLFSHFDWSMVWTCAVPAITLAALGTIDTLLTSVVADSLTKTKHKGNRE